MGVLFISLKSSLLLSHSLNKYVLNAEHMSLFRFCGWINKQSWESLCSCGVYILSQKDR